MKVLLRGIFKLLGIAGMGVAGYIIVNWYIHWLSYHFIGSMKISILVGILTFFISPIAAAADLLWNSFESSTLAMWKFFLIYFIAGRFLFFIGEKLDNK